MEKSSLDRTLMALADPTRRGVVEALNKGPKHASELAEMSGVSRPLMSRHLKILRQHQIIEAHRVENDARLRYFRLKQQPLKELSDWLETMQGFWNQQLEAFKHHAEGFGKERLS